MTKTLFALAFTILTLSPMAASAQTRCADGTYSSSSGSGTCSWHGGIAGPGSSADPTATGTLEVFTWSFGYGFLLPSLAFYVVAAPNDDIGFHVASAFFDLLGAACITMAMLADGTVSEAEWIAGGIGLGGHALMSVLNLVSGIVVDRVPVRFTLYADANSGGITVAGQF